MNYKLFVLVADENGQIYQVVLNPHETDRVKVFIEHIKGNDLKFEPVEGFEV